jgi:hypothetical protein
MTVRGNLSAAHRQSDQILHRFRRVRCFCSVTMLPSRLRSLKEQASFGVAGRPGTRLAQAGNMAEKSLADRVAALEASMGSKSIEEQFRDQAELIDRRFSQEFSDQAQLIDRLFAYRFEEFNKKWDVKFRAFEGKFSAEFAGLESALESRLEAKLETTLETKLEAKLKPIRNDLRGVKNDLAVVKKTLKIIVARLR